jgi:Spy/CpxP family protein refolding chaperone
MFGFIIGTACLIGLVKVLRRGRYACGAHGMGPRPFGGRGFGGWGGHRGGRQFFLSFLFDRLETTPAQEKVIVGALEELREAAWAQRGEMRKTRVDVAAAVRSPSFDETRMGELFARHDTAIEAMRRASVGAIGKVHAVLEDRQRERLADLIEAGPAAIRWGGYRDAWRGYRGEVRGGEGDWA